MKFARFIKEETIRTGLVTEKGVLDLTASGCALTMDDIFRGGEECWALLEETAKRNDAVWLDDGALVWAPPAAPSKILCVGLNYGKHIAETNEDKPTTPVIFCKMPESLNAHGQSVELPPRSDRLIDYEAELVIVIGKEAYHVSESEAAEHIFGYTCGNDVSDRAAQFISSQMLIGKGCPGFAPVGPYLVTADELDPSDLRIRCFVNGECRQDSKTSEMIYSPSFLVSYLSRYIRLNPGDMIFTGTPDGVIIGYPPEERVWLAPGDEVTVEIENIGVLSNRFIQ